MQINFDLDEFIAYLLNGSLLVILLSLYMEQTTVASLFLGFATSDATNAAVSIVVFGALAIISGHVSSIFARVATRRVIWALVGRPREAPFSEGEDSFWKGHLKERLNQSFHRLFNFGDETLNRDIKTFAPRLIRAFVLATSESTRFRRDRIVRARSLCANAVLPLSLFTTYFITIDEYFWAGIAAGVTLAMLHKQHDLDKREWKEIYLSYLALVASSSTTETPTKDLPDAI